MTFAQIEAILAMLLPALPQAITDVSTGEGGLQKVVKVGGDLLNAVSTVHQVIAAHPAVTAASTDPQPGTNTVVGA